MMNLFQPARFAIHIERFTKNCGYEFRFQCGALQRWIARTFTPTEYAKHQNAWARLEDWRICAIHAEQTVQALRLERADLTEILLSLVAKDEEGLWTTVFGEDTRLPAETCVLLDELVSRA